MATKHNTTDLDTKNSAIALLAAAGDLDVDPMLIRTRSGDGRVSFDAPQEVYDEAEADGFVPILAEVTATFTAHDPGGAANIQVTVALSEVTPEREITVQVGGFTRNMTTGDTLEDDIQFATGWTGNNVRITDDETGTTSGDVELAMDGADATLEVTLHIPA